MKKVFNFVEFFNPLNKLQRIPPKMTIFKPKIQSYAEQQMIIMPNKQKLKTKIKKFYDQGKHNIEVMSDFDYTLTKYRYGGHYNQAGLSIFANTKLISEETSAYFLYSMFLKKNNTNTEMTSILQSKYQPQSVYKWYLFTHKAIGLEKLNKQTINLILHEFTVAFRYGIEDFLQFSNTYPFLIVSGGIYDFIYYWLEKISKDTISKIDVVGNQLDYRNDILVGFKQPIIYGYVKGDIAQAWKKRKNAIIIGDQLSDINIANQRDNESYISICFMNNTFDCESIYEKFDIIVLSDPSLLTVNYLLGFLSNNVKKQTVENLENIGCEHFIKFCKQACV